MTLSSMTRRHLEENLQLGIFLANITGNRRLGLSLTGLASRPISIRKPLVPQEPATFLGRRWEASHSPCPKISVSMYWPPICYSATQSGQHRKCRKGAGIHMWEEVSAPNVRT